MFSYKLSNSFYFFSGKCWKGSVAAFSVKVACKSCHIPTCRDATNITTKGWTKHSLQDSHLKSQWQLAAKKLFVSGCLTHLYEPLVDSSSAWNAKLPQSLNRRHTYCEMFPLFRSVICLSVFACERECGDGPRVVFRKRDSNDIAKGKTPFFGLLKIVNPLKQLSSGLVNALPLRDYMKVYLSSRHAGHPTLLTPAIAGRRSYERRDSQLHHPFGDK